MSYFETGSTQLIARSSYAGVDGFTDALKKLGSALKSGASSALNFYGNQQQQAGQIQAYQQQAAARAGGGGMPGWVMPVAIVGGVGLLALVLLKRKKRNPSRGKGRHRKWAQSAEGWHPTGERGDRADWVAPGASRRVRRAKRLRAMAKRRGRR